MLLTLLILCGLIWLPILLYYMMDKSFAVLLVWLLIAPIGLNLLQHPNRNPLFSAESDVDYVDQFLHEKAEKEARQAGIRKGHRSQEASIRLDEILEPTRLLLLALLFMLVMNRFYRKIPLAPFNTTERWMFAFLVLLVVNIFFLSSRLPNSLKIATDAFFIPFVAYYVMRRLVNDEARFKQFLHMLMALGLMLVFIALLERASNSGLTYRLRGPFAHRDQFYIVLMAIFFMMLLYRARYPHGPGKPLTFGAVCCRSLLWSAPIIIFATWTRTNWISFLAAIGVTLFFVRHFVSRRGKIAVIGLAILLIPLLLISLQVLIPAEAIDSRIANEKTIYSRIGAWIVQLQAGIRNPVLGIGFTNVRDLLYENHIYFMGVRSLVHSHNCFLAMFVELGLVGLVAYLAIAVSITREGLRRFRGAGRRADRWLGVVSIAILSGHLTPGLASTVLYVPTVSHVYVYACLGAIAGVAGSAGVSGVRIRRMEPERMPAA